MAVLSSQPTVGVCPSSFPATYYVEVQSAQGCSKKDSTTIYANGADESNLTGNNSAIIVENDLNESSATTAGNEKKSISAANSLSVNLYPNPSTEKVFVQLNATEELLQIKLTDLAGNQMPVKSQKEIGQGLHELNVKHLAVGSYILPARLWWHNRNVFRFVPKLAREMVVKRRCLLVVLHFYFHHLLLVPLVSLVTLRLQH